MTIEAARELLNDMTKSASLLRHMETVSLVMEAYAEKYGEDKNEWAVAGLLHDADYEAHPEEHPQIIVKKLRDLGEEKIAHAISAHYTHWKVPYTTLLDKALLACDELTGFIVACCQVRPEGIESLEPKSVIKKLKDKGFAAKVDRNEVHQGTEMLGVPLPDHIAFIINTLRNNREVLGL